MGLILLGMFRLREEMYAFMVRPDALEVWKYEEVRRRLSWYYLVMTKHMPPKYMIVKRISLPSDIGDIGNLDMESLFSLHGEMRKEFLSLWKSIRNKKDDLKNYSPVENSFLDLKIEIVNRLLSPCILCEHRCRVDRVGGRRGFCGLDLTTRVTSAFLHLGEEAPLVPSGTIFFSGCSFKCVFCQNWDISSNPFSGEAVDSERLARITRSLAARGARNINYVGGNPDQNLHTILGSLKHLELNVPLLWNSNLYTSLEAMELLIDIIDIWLPDFKYGNSECAFKYSRIKNYFEIVSRNHKIAYDFGDDIIIRHLVMPNHIECCTKKVLDWIHKNTPNVLVNVMDQYRPEHRVVRDPSRFREIARRLHSWEIKEAYEYADKLGIAYRYVS
jgi:putative pyruvate formate lyase activating enzyme